MAEPMLADRPDQPPGEDVVPLLDQLVGLGLVAVRGSGQVRFRLLDVVRDFALERAAARDELTTARIRHARVIADVAATITPELAGPQQAEAVARLDDISGDLAGALTAAAADDPPTALRLAAGLPRWWRFRGQDRDGRAWLERLLKAPANSNGDPGVRAWALLGIAMLAAEHGDGDGTVPGVDEALASFTRLADVTGQLAAHIQLCALHQAYGRYALAREHGVQAVALATRHGRTRETVVAQNNLTWHDIRVGDLAAARRRLTMVRRLAAEAGEDRLAALAVANLAEVARLDGRYAEAVAAGPAGDRAAGGARRSPAQAAGAGHRRVGAGAVGAAGAGPVDAGEGDRRTVRRPGRGVPGAGQPGIRPRRLSGSPSAETGADRAGRCT